MEHYRGFYVLGFGEIQSIDSINYYPEEPEEEA